MVRFFQCALMFSFGSPLYPMVPPEVPPSFPRPRETKDREIHLVVRGSERRGNAMILENELKEKKRKEKKRKEKKRKEKKRKEKKRKEKRR